MPDNVVRQRARRPDHQKGRKRHEQPQARRHGDGGDGARRVREAEERVRVRGDRSGLPDGLAEQDEAGEHARRDGSVLVQELHRPGAQLPLLGSRPDLVRGCRRDGARADQQTQERPAAVPRDELRVRDRRQGHAGAHHPDRRRHGPRRPLAQEDGLGEEHGGRDGDLGDLVKAHGVELEVEVVEDDVSHVGRGERGEGLFGEDLLLVDACEWGKREREKERKKERERGERASKQRRRRRKPLSISPFYQKTHRLPGTPSFPPRSSACG